VFSIKQNGNVAATFSAASITFNTIAVIKAGSRCSIHSGRINMVGDVKSTVEHERDNNVTKGVKYKKAHAQRSPT